MDTYTVLEVRKWGTENIFSITFEEDKSEPIDWFEPSFHPTVGAKVHGKVEEYTTNSGGKRRKFVTEESLKQEDKRQLEINTSWAITNALNIAPDYEPETIKQHAAMLLHIKEELMK